MSMTIQSSVKDKILATSSETSKVKANVVIEALSRKERVKPRRVRAMAMTIQYGVRGMILTAQSEAFKQENVPLVGSEWSRPMTIKIEMDDLPRGFGRRYRKVLRTSIFSLCYLFRNPFSSTTMGDENPIRTLGDYSKPSHEGYRNTIELPVGNNVDRKSSQRYPNVSTTSWRIFIRSMDSFQGLTPKSPSSWHRSLAPSLNFYDRVNPVTRRTIDQSVSGKLRDLNAEESWALLEDLALYDNESWNDPRDFAKSVKAISLPQDVPSTSNCRLIELENQVQRLMEAHLALTQPTQVNKITTSYEICSGPHDTQYCMEDPEQAFVEYASSRTDETGEGLVSKFMASQDARLSKFEADFKRQQGEMTNKIDTVLKAITDQIAGTLPSNTVKNLKLGTHPVLSTRSYSTKDPQCSTHIHSSINAITIHPKQPEEPQDNEPDVGQEEKGNLGNINSNPHPQPDLLASIATEQVRKLNSMLESLGLVPQSSNTKFVYTKEDDGEVMVIEIIQNDDEPQNESCEGTTMEGLMVEYFDTFPTRNELTYHKKLNPREDANGGISNFTRRIKGMHFFIGNFTYIVDFMIIEDIRSIIVPRLSQVVLGKPFIEISNMTHDPPEGVVKFTNRDDEVAYKMPHKIEQYNLLSNLENEHTKSVYLRNEEDMRRGVDYVTSKILGFYKECFELGPEYVTGLEDEGEVTLYLMRRSLEVLRKFHWMILRGRFNQLSHVSSPLLSKPGEY
ncbi:hypothetical protein Tco_1006494 [Tanacetum coccineum]|uniref:MAK10-like protein n=1 Tax=Tanacetum coccineum TaxID=301880 RepID=A0ABQ5FHU0_9ASTR